MEAETEQLIRDFKQTFEPAYAKRVLEHLKLFCRGGMNQGMSVPESANQTFYNLGANAVYRYIQHQIDRELDEKPEQDCIIEPEKGKE